MALGIYRMGAIYYKICIDSYEIYLLECFISPLTVRKAEKVSSTLIINSSGNSSCTVNDNFWQAISVFMFHGECMVN